MARPSGDFGKQSFPGIYKRHEARPCAISCFHLFHGHIQTGIESGFAGLGLYPRSGRDEALPGMDEMTLILTK